MTRPLSKSALQVGAQCPRALWFRYYKSFEKDAVPDDNAEEMFRIGNIVGGSARFYFDNFYDDEMSYSVTIDTDRGFSPEYYYDYAQQTANAMQDPNCHTIAEATFYVDDLVVFVDLLHRNPDGGWDIYEVKSSRQAKPVHVMDCSWQTYIVRDLCGVDIRNSYLMIPARGNWYMDGQSCSPDDFIIVDTYTDYIANYSRSGEIPAQINAFWDMLSNQSFPPPVPDDVDYIGSSDRCRSPYQCNFTGICSNCQSD